jgi:hypothetical protein
VKYQFTFERKERRRKKDGTNGVSDEVVDGGVLLLLDGLGGSVLVLEGVD